MKRKKYISTTFRHVFMVDGGGREFKQHIIMNDLIIKYEKQTKIYA